VVVDRVGAYMIGNLIISLIAGVSTFACLESVRVPFALPLAVTVAFTDLIPMVGATLGATICVIVSAFTADIWPRAVIVLVFFIAYQQLENYLIAPRVLRNSHQGWTCESVPRSRRIDSRMMNTVLAV
jgi:predicted PurR-regulated permease PerM